LRDPFYEFRELTGREYNILLCQNIHSRAEALKAFQDGRLQPSKIKYSSYGFPEKLGTCGLGKKTFKKLAAWSGYEVPPKPVKKRKVCPHCGGEL
jgi:hypothetical protein